MEISIDGVTRITISEIDEYEPDEEDEEEEPEPYYRSITIETTSGVIEIDLNAASEDALDVILDEEEDDEDEDE